MRILITGSRSWTHASTVTTAICAAAEGLPWSEVTIVHGACTGADSIAAWFAHSVGAVSEPHPAEWERYGKAAGPRRNQQMVDLGADICLAFPVGESRGTQDCMRRAETAGIPVRRTDWTDSE